MSAKFPNRDWKSVVEPVLRRLAPALVETRRTAAPVTLTGLFTQKLLGINRRAYWPMHFTSRVSAVERISIGIGTAPGLSPHCYIQGVGGITLGDYTLVGPGVGLISANHDPVAISKHLPGGIHIGRYCWLGMNSVILPGVTLGDHTIVGAGSVVTRSFPDGYCVVAGNPARLVRQLDPDCVEEATNPFPYVGFRRALSASPQSS